MPPGNDHSRESFEMIAKRRSVQVSLNLLQNFLTTHSLDLDGVNG
jgi:hypothetical protein